MHTFSVCGCVNPTTEQKKDVCQAIRKHECMPLSRLGMKDFPRRNTGDFVHRSLKAKPPPLPVDLGYATGQYMLVKFSKDRNQMRLKCVQFLGSC